MQQSLLFTQESARSKKALLFAAVGVVAVVGIIACAVYIPRAQPVQQFNEVDGVENFIAEAFGKWTAKYNKVYATKDEMIYRMKVFRDNFYKIKQISDEGSNSFTVGLNVMADLTHEEFVARYIGGLQKREERNVQVLETDSLPDKIDWREKGAVSAVKDQGFCGSCWAFSATGALEGLHAIKAGSLETYSEQELVDCSRDYGNYGCNGGLMTYAFEYVRDHSIATDKDYKYEGVDRKCRSEGKTRAYKISGYTDVEENNEDQLAAAVANQPVSVAVEADSSVFQFYTSGVIDSNSCGTDLNHGILAVGYDNTASKPHWVVKNSWGAGWGDKGYVRIKKNTSGKKGKGICGIAMMNTFPNA